MVTLSQVIGGDLNAARQQNRWGKAKPRLILNDAGALLQVPFAKQANTAVAAYNAPEDGVLTVTGKTLLRKLVAISHRVLPTQQLDITADNITVRRIVDGSNGEPYSVTEMSDGEKAVFYIIGQRLVADRSSVFIMDEPEFHVHRSISVGSGTSWRRHGPIAPFFSSRITWSRAAIGQQSAGVTGED